MNNYLNTLKETNNWNEKVVVETIKSILNKFMGEPPVSFMAEGKQYTPLTYLNEYLKLKMNDYYSFMSTNDVKFNEAHELVEADNWWHADNYYNISLTDYYELIKSAIKKGESMCICGDVSEPGYDSELQVAIIPTFDIPSESINDDSRQFRLKNETTTDDHCIHLVGYYEIDGVCWFLAKDSGAGSWNNSNSLGYRFLHEDFVKLKIMNVLVHKDFAPILNKIIK
jgi:bleomycin hydrolase